MFYKSRVITLRLTSSFFSAVSYIAVWADFDKNETF